VVTDVMRARLAADRAATAAQADALRRELAGVIAAQSDVATDDEHDPEGSTIAFERARLTALLEQSERSIDALDRALTRVDDGGYGTCRMGGRDIAPERLAARPSADTCIACAT
jgi:RNA polymerase-binding transcription factor DksA